MTKKKKEKKKDKTYFYGFRFVTENPPQYADMPTCLHADMPELNKSDLVWTEQVWSCPVLQIRYEAEGKQQHKTYFYGFRLLD